MNYTGKFEFRKLRTWWEIFKKFNSWSKSYFLTDLQKLCVYYNLDKLSNLRVLNDKIFAIK